MEEEKLRQIFIHDICKTNFNCIVLFYANNYFCNILVFLVNKKTNKCNMSGI